MYRGKILRCMATQFEQKYALWIFFPKCVKFGTKSTKVRSFWTLKFLGGGVCYEGTSIDSMMI